jgi:branched-chain amino acid transport system ATP-binding protein
VSALLEVRDLDKRFGGVHAVRGASFVVAEGEVFGLIGPNGAGKTTVVNLVTSYVPPTSGSVLFAGAPTTGVARHRLAARGLARTFQNLQLFEGVTVLGNVLIGRHRMFTDKRWQLWRARRQQEREHLDAARRLLDRLGLSEVADTDVGGLPYGMRRRVEVARALATEPKLLLLDEPTAGMTRRESDDIGALIKAINASGVTVLLVDHNVRLVSEVCDRVAVMDWGEVIAEGPPEQVWADARVREAYLGVDRPPRGERAGAAATAGGGSDAGDQ